MKHCGYLLLCTNMTPTLATGWICSCRGAHEYQTCSHPWKWKWMLIEPFHHPHAQHGGEHEHEWLQWHDMEWLRVQPLVPELKLRLELGLGLRLQEWDPEQERELQLMPL